MRTLQNLGVVSSIVLSSSAALAQDAVQWRVEDGGNGHWYQGVPLDGTISWQEAHDAALLSGAHLATATSDAEFDWVVQTPGSSAALWNGSRGPYIGGEQLGTGSLDGWRWVTGEPWFPRWGVGTCGADNFCDADALTIGRCSSGAEISYNDWPKIIDSCSASVIVGAILEWSADCNNDGIVDYGQIRAGELEDLDANNIPDCCENGTNCDPCRADIDQSGNVTGVDLAAILNNWGTSGGKQPRSDVNGDGVVDGADLAELLNSWGPCP